MQVQDRYGTRRKPVASITTTPNAQKKISKKKKTTIKKKQKQKNNKKQPATDNEGTTKEAKPNCESTAEEDSRIKRDKEESNDDSK